MKCIKLISTHINVGLLLISHCSVYLDVYVGYSYNSMYGCVSIMCSNAIDF